MEKPTPNYYKRQFLESPRLNAADSYIVTSVEYGGYTNAELKLTDCTRSVHLNFQCGKNKKKGLAKLDKIIKQLEEFRSALEKS